MTPVDGAAVGGSSSPWPSSSVTVVDGPAVGGSSSPWLSFFVTPVEGAAVGGSSSPWSSSSVTVVDGPAVGESSSPWLSFSVSLVDGAAVGESSSSVTRVDGPTVGCASSVTAAAAKSSPVKRFVSYGHSPHMLKPFTALEGVAVRRNTFAKMPAMSQNVIRRPGLHTIQLSAVALYTVWGDLK